MNNCYYKRKGSEYNHLLEIHAVSKLCYYAQKDWYELPIRVRNTYELGGVVFCPNGLYWPGIALQGKFEDLLVYDIYWEIWFFVSSQQLNESYEKVSINNMENQNQQDSVLYAQQSRQGLIDQKNVAKSQGQQDNTVQECQKESLVKDMVNHPLHYTTNPQFETIKVLKAWLTPEAYEGFLIGNTLKYLSRYKHKNGTQDLDKGDWYLDTLIEEYKSGYLK